NLAIVAENMTWEEKYAFTLDLQKVQNDIRKHINEIKSEKELCRFFKYQAHAYLQWTEALTNDPYHILEGWNVHLSRKVTIFLDYGTSLVQILGENIPLDLIVWLVNQLCGHDTGNLTIRLVTREMTLSSLHERTENFIP